MKNAEVRSVVVINKYLTRVTVECPHCLKLEAIDRHGKDVFEHDCQHCGKRHKVDATQ